jgi:hypothetical protein
VQVIKLFIMQSPPASRHFLALRSKYSPQHPSSNTLSLCSPVVWETKLHTHTKQIKLQLLDFKLYVSRDETEDKRFWIEW